MNDDIVVTEIEDGVATVTINRPDRRNAMSNAVVDELTRRISGLSDDEEAQVVVLTGAGDKAFCAGGDLMDQGGGGGMLKMHEERGGFADLLIEMNRCKSPIVSRVNGHALGGGLGLVLNSDIAVASTDAQLGTPEVKVGLFPMMILSVIQRNMGRKRAMEMVLTGKKFEAEDAVEHGIVNYAVAPDELDEKVNELVEQIAGFSPAVLQMGRRAFYETQDMGFEEQLRTLHKDLTLNTLTEDAGEGVMAFIEKREPEWKGK